MASEFVTIKKIYNRIASSKVTYDDGSLKIEGLDQGNSINVVVFFENAIFVRIADEGVRLGLCKEMANGFDLVMEHLDSNLIGWLADETLGSRDLRQARHFLVAIGEEIIDVVSFNLPKIDVY